MRCGEQPSSCSSTASAKVITPIGVSAGSWSSHACAVRSRWPRSSARTERSKATRSGAGVSSRGGPISYSTVACSCETSSGGAVAVSRWPSKGDHDPQSGHRQRRACGSICENGLSTPPQEPHVTGSRLTVCSPSIALIGEKRRPSGAPSASAPAACGQRCHERRTPLAASSAAKSTPGPGWIDPGEERVCGAGVAAEAEAGVLLALPPAEAEGAVVRPGAALRSASTSAVRGGGCCGS
mmetsp:Transcript_36882/g.109696  ORF Transcript_36882/g.109696 Transcript_36882/m.109696 type:complete len:239 (+) Transcript_36882:208-924(+)